MKLKHTVEYDLHGRAVLLSDLHLTPESTRQEERLRRFLGERVDGAERLFILGDLFEFWIGGKHSAHGEYQNVLDMLEQIVAGGIPITVLHGNRDFHMGSELERETGVELVKEAIVLHSGGRRIYVCHGDTFCTRDRVYQRARTILRHPVAMFAYRSLPRFVAHYLADGYRDTSTRVGMNKNDGKTSIVLDAVESVFDRGFDAVICGHVHTPRRLNLHRDDGEKTLLVLGDWSERGWYAQVEGDRLEILSFE